MANDKEVKGDEEECCSKEGCGCGGKRCGGCQCGVKILLALILFLLGGVIGFLGGSRCGGYHHMMAMCPYSATSAPAPTK